MIKVFGPLSRASRTRDTIATLTLVSGRSQREGFPDLPKSRCALWDRFCSYLSYLLPITFICDIQRYLYYLHLNCCPLWIYKTPGVLLVSSLGFAAMWRWGCPHLKLEERTGWRVWVAFFPGVFSETKQYCIISNTSAIDHRSRPSAEWEH